MRQFVFIIEIIQLKHNLLRPANGERRYYQLSFFLNASVLNNPIKLIFGTLFILMKPVTIGALSDDIITLLESGWWFKKVIRVPTDVASVSYCGHLTIII